MSWLFENGYRAVSIEKLISTPTELRSKMIGLTFDDCFQDVYENALPILTKYKFNATFFAVPGYDDITLFGSSKYQNWSSSQTADYNIPFTFMKSYERKKLLDLGMEIGCHTMSHRNLDELTSSEQEFEIKEAKKTLEKQLGFTVSSFCYPRGRYNLDTLTLVKKYGFKVACTTKRQYVKAHHEYTQIPRFSVGNSFIGFKAIVSGRGENLSLIDRVQIKIGK